MQEWILILFLYADGLWQEDPVGLTSVAGFHSEKSCLDAGKRGEELVNKTVRKSRFICVNTSVSYRHQKF